MARTQGIENLHPYFDGRYWRCPQLTEDEERWLDLCQGYVYSDYSRQYTDQTKAIEGWARVVNALKNMTGDTCDLKPRRLAR